MDLLEVFFLIHEMKLREKIDKKNRAPAQRWWAVVFAKLATLRLCPFDFKGLRVPKIDNLIVRCKQIVCTSSDLTRHAFLALQFFAILLLGQLRQQIKNQYEAISWVVSSAKWHFGQWEYGTRRYTWPGERCYSLSGHTCLCPLISRRKTAILYWIARKATSYLVFLEAWHFHSEHQHYQSSWVNLPGTNSSYTEAGLGSYCVWCGKNLEAAIPSGLSICVSGFYPIIWANFEKKF